MKYRNILLMGGLVVAALMLGLIAPVGNVSLAAGAILYVDADATGANDGTSWTSAYPELQLALDAAVSGDQIWVAEGIYKPAIVDENISDRYRAFQMMNGVALYGGFDPTVGDEAWDERDWDNNITILSGDLGVVGEASDNSYHVFYHPLGTNLDSTAILDGFTIRDGNANGEAPHDRGGGMYNTGGNPTLTNVFITENTAAQDGGGMHNDSSSPALTEVSFVLNFATGGRGGGMFNLNSSPVLVSSYFGGNYAGDDGGGMYNEGSNPIVTDVEFAGNVAVDQGGGMHNLNANGPVLTRVTFYSNTANSGGGMSDQGSNPSLIDVTFDRNSAANFGGGMYDDASDSSLDHVLFTGNNAAWGGGMCNNGGSPSFANVTFSWNTASAGGGMLNQQSTDLTLTDIIFLGNGALAGGGLYNSNSILTLANATFTGNIASQNGGGIFNEFSQVTLVNITVSGNSALSGSGIFNFDSYPTLINAIIWGNTPLVNQILSNRIAFIRYSVVQGGCPSEAACEQVIDLDPLFIKNPSTGADGVWGTIDDVLGDLRLQLTSPAIDAGDNTGLPDGLTHDLLGLPRFTDILSIPDTGFGVPPIVDMGAYEAQAVVVFLPIVTR